MVEIENINIDEIEFPDKIITFMDYIRELPDEMQPTMNSVAKNIANLLSKKYNIDFMTLMKMDYTKALRLIAKYEEQKNVREEKAFLAQRSKDS